MDPYPIVFEPILKERIWGGERLARLQKPVPAGAKIGESWEIADLPPEIEGGQSVIANGPLAGMTLHEVIESDRGMMLGHAHGEVIDSVERFPLLVKYLDARENLSVQVHPDETYARKHPGAHLKSEAWVVVEAEPGSIIYKGLQPGVTRETFRRHLETGQAVDDLIAIEARPGDCHYLPSGTCHALGAGVLVAEVQTPSDTTFRVYDWGRGRPLQIREALECIRFGDEPAETTALPPPAVYEEYAISALCVTEFFTIDRIEARSGNRMDAGAPGLPIVWMILRGSGGIAVSGADDVEFASGTTVLLPAAIKGATARFDTDTVALRVSIPARSEGIGP